MTLFAALAAVSLAGLAPVAAAQVAQRVTQHVDDGQRTTLAGHLRPFLSRATDLGPLGDDVQSAPIMLMLSRTPQQQADLDALVEAQHNPKSPQFHKWLTPVQFGARFSPADGDIAAVRTWLQSEGLKVLDVPPSKTYISFSGTVGQLKTAFGVSIHKLTIDGDAHVATVNEPQVPSALAPVIGGLHNLDDFGGKPLVKNAGLFHKDPATGKMLPVSTNTQPRAQLDDGSGDYLVGPQDFYTIYNEEPLLSASTPVNGAGTTIALIEEAQVVAADVTNFRSVFGLPAYPATPNATAGGVNYYYGNSTTGLNGYASCYAPATTTAGKRSGEEGEADLDLQWSGTVAPNAIIDFVACGGTKTSADGTTLGALGIDHSAQYIVNYLSSSVVAASMSYGECEADMSASATSGVGYYNNQWEQFASEGITPVISSGDGGSTQCYQNDEDATTLPPSVNGFGSSAYNVSAGGTDLGDLYETNNYATTPASTWWNATNGPGLGTALKYVPETSWAGYCSNPLFASFLQADSSTTFGSVYNPIAICSSSYSTTNGYTAIVGGAGGASTYTTIPSWQNVYGVGQNNVSTTHRNLPDISLFAANGFWGHLLPYCESDEYSCAASAFEGTNTSYSGAGGTSFVSPQLAGLMALIVQKTGQSQGQADYVLYPLAASEYGTTGTAGSALTACTGSGVSPTGTPTSTCIFHDISNDMPSLQGGTITPDNAQPCVRADSTYCDGTIGTTNYTYGISVVPGTTASTGQFAYLAGPGYDDATGLGSVNISNLVNNWQSASGGGVFTPTVAVTPAITTYTYGATHAAISYVATVSGPGSYPTGSVDFSGAPTIGDLGTDAIVPSAACKTGGTCVESATQSYTAPVTLAAGSYTVTGDYSTTNENYTANSGTASLVISPATGTVTVSPESGIYGETATLSATVAYAGTGAAPSSFSFTVGTGPVVAATCTGTSSPVTCTTSYPLGTLAVGTQTITGTVGGNYTGSGTNTATIAKQTPTVTVAAVTAPYGDTAVPLSLTIAYVGTGAPPSGAVGFQVNGAHGVYATCTGTSSPLTCTANDNLSTLAIGQYSIYGGNQPDANYNTGSNTNTLTITQATPTIVFNVPSPQHTVDSPITVSATSNSPAPITYSVVSGPATISGQTVTLTGPGTVTLQASQAATTDYSASSAQTTFTVLAGSIWVAGYNNIFSVFDLLGNAVFPSGVSGEGTGTIGYPLSVAFDASGNYWIANSNGLSEFSKNTSATLTTPYANGGLSNPDGVAIDGLGNVWAVNSNGTVSELTNTGTALSPSGGFTGASGSPRAVAVDLSGNVWVSNGTGNSVTEFLGGGAPVPPLSTGVANSSTGARP